MTDNAEVRRQKAEVNEPREVARFQFFHVVQEPLLPGRKTRGYVIRNNRTGGMLGTIEWYGPWRQFCVLPFGDTVWSAGCLDDLQRFLVKLKAGGYGR